MPLSQVKRKTVKEALVEFLGGVRIIFLAMAPPISYGLGIVAVCVITLNAYGIRAPEVDVNYVTLVAAILVGAAIFNDV